MDFVLSGRLMFQIIGAMAEFERALIQERVRAGLRNARAKGRRLGRPRVIVDAAKIASLRTPGYRCGMKSFASTRELCGFHRAPPPCALPPIQSLLIAPSHLSLATVWLFCQPPDVCCYLLRLPTHLRRTSTNPLHFIQFA
jgi:hypothetical protein